MIFENGDVVTYLRKDYIVQKPTRDIILVGPIVMTDEGFTVNSEVCVLKLKKRHVKYFPCGYYDEWFRDNAEFLDMKGFFFYNS